MDKAYLTTLSKALTAHVKSYDSATRPRIRAGHFSVYMADRDASEFAKKLNEAGLSYHVLTYSDLDETLNDHKITIRIAGTKAGAAEKAIEALSAAGGPWGV